MILDQTTTEQNLTPASARRSAAAELAALLASGGLGARLVEAARCASRDIADADDRPTATDRTGFNGRVRADGR